MKDCCGNWGKQRDWTEIVKQLARNGVMVLLTARDVKRGTEAVEKLKESGLTMLRASGIIVEHLDSSTKESMEQGGLLGFRKIVSTAVQDYKKAEECLDINYYGTKKVIDSLIPLFQLSHSPRIVNVSSIVGKLQNIPSESIKKNSVMLDNLTEEKLDELLQRLFK
ncbi:hypothetical protein J5N97_022958 [Dioscorea zingiberensis]|uniref:Uncharacterized protein n=1 Tax=Dioscorea zingiberensis TaxID=325984 RepID=A0A9D5HB30_9LILI|nr:hypothetical protein J5N97_022958 [Dioscorea zingiberensis]